MDLTTILQTSTGTEENRYVEIFDEASRVYPEAKEILSYGCSSGEELESLSRRWPNAAITGVEILDTVRQAASERFPQHRIVHPHRLGAERFDMITAMSVLCRWPEVNGPLPFPLFQDTAQLIDQHLKPGGLLIVFNTTYDFAAAQPEYKALNFYPTLKLPSNSRSRLIVRPRNPDGSASRSLHPVFFVKPGGESGAVFPYGEFTKDEHPIPQNDFRVRDRSDAIRKMLRSRMGLDGDRADLIMKEVDHQIRMTAEAYEQITTLQKDVSRLTISLRNIKNSNSWRLTAPLRSSRRALGKLMRRVI